MSKTQFSNGKHKKQQKNLGTGGSKPQWPGQNPSKASGHSMNQHSGKTQQSGQKSGQKK